MVASLFILKTKRSIFMRTTPKNTINYKVALGRVLPFSGRHASLFQLAIFFFFF